MPTDWQALFTCCRCFFALSVISTPSTSTCPLVGCSRPLRCCTSVDLPEPVWPAMAVMLDQTYILYDPEIIFNRITWVSYIFYAAYAVMLLLPLGLELYGVQRLKSSLAGAYR